MRDRDRPIRGHGEDLDQLLEVAPMVFGVAPLRHRWANPAARTARRVAVGAIGGGRGRVVVQLGHVDPVAADRSHAQLNQQARPVRREQPFVSRARPLKSVDLVVRTPRNVPRTPALRRRLGSVAVGMDNRSGSFASTRRRLP